MSLLTVRFHVKEPHSLETIRDFIRIKYFSTYDVYAKIDVNGPFEHPLFTFLKSWLTFQLWQTLTSHRQTVGQRRRSRH